MPERFPVNQLTALTARQLLDTAREKLGVRSMYALAKRAEIPPQRVQRYYRVNRMPQTARQLIIRVLNAA